MARIEIDTTGIDFQPAIRSLESVRATLEDMQRRIAAAATAAPVATAPGPAGIGHNSGEPDLLTLRSALEIVSHESIVQEAYKDSKGIWTWGIGVTSRSGHKVDRYKDNPQPIRRCLEIYIWLLRKNYIPDVLTEFTEHKLTEAQFTAALSFHYNTGAIRRASWVDLFLDGKIAEAKAAIMEWRSPPEIIERRKKERDLFFDGVWSGDGKATVYEVSKPSYSPKWRSARRVDISADLRALIGAPA